MTNNIKIPPIVALIFSIIAVSTAAVMIRVAQKEASSLVIAFYRLGIASLVFAPFAFQKKSEILSLQKKQVFFLVLAGIFLALHFASWITSLEYTSVASSAVLVTTSPLWVALVSTLFFKIKIPPVVWIGLVVALAGGIVVGLSENILNGSSNPVRVLDFGQGLAEKSVIGNGLALAGAWFVAGYLLIGKKMRGGLSLAVYAFIVFGSATVILFFMALFAGQEFFGFSVGTFLCLLGLALGPQIMGHAVFNWALKYLSATYVSVSLLAEPVGSVILAFFVLGEKPNLLEILGGALILAGIYLASRASDK